MSETKNLYYDDNTKNEDTETQTGSQNSSVEPLPESSRPRRDGPGGN